MWACENLGVALGSSVKQNWNLQEVSQAATEEPATPPPPSLHAGTFCYWMHSQLHWGSRLRSKTPDEVVMKQTDYWLTEARLMWEEGRIHRRSRRETEGEGRIFQADDWSCRWAVSPPTSPHLSSLCPCLVPFPPTKERRQSGSGAKTKLDSHIFSTFSASFPLFMSDLISL